LIESNLIASTAASPSTVIWMPALPLRHFFGNEHEVETRSDMAFPITISGNNKNGMQPKQSSGREAMPYILGRAEAH
jgi:hypothetical protein